ncbi:hypothetical protein JMUB6875_47640 [Nocardia sp. JMUB6875]
MATTPATKHTPATALHTFRVRCRPAGNAAVRSMLMVNLPARLLNSTHGTLSLLTPIRPLEADTDNPPHPAGSKIRELSDR